MHLTGHYDSHWYDSNILLYSTSDKISTVSIRFYDEKGETIHNTQPMDILPHGTVKIHINKIKSLEGKYGLFVVECDPAIKGEYRYVADDGPMRAVYSLSEGKLPFLVEGRTVFISYAMRKENTALYSLVSRFVTGLRFKVLSASETGRADLPPGIQIKDMIRLSDSVIAILTKDVKSGSRGKKVSYPSLNVVDEIGQASDKSVIMLVEEGTEVPSNIKTRATYISFSRNKTGDLIVNLLDALQKEGLI